MSPIILTTQTKGIYHHLPTFPDHDGKKYTAIVTGANGITGSEIVDVLAESPERWETIYALSRRPPMSTNPRVKSVSADFLASPEDIVAVLKKEGVTADYIFFASYVQPAPKEGEGLWSNVDEMNSLNGSLLTDFLTALTLTNIIPTRFLLQTGGKHYALHLGPTAIPMLEDAPRIKHPNFYFGQEDALSEWCRKHDTHYTVTRPGFIIGAVKEASMNITFALAIYASIQRELGLKLEFPADVAAWDVSKDLSAVRLIAYHAEWAVLTNGAEDQALNIVDDSRFSWGGFWGVLAGWYGIPAGIPEENEGKYVSVSMPLSPPPRGFGKAGEVRMTWSFEAWAKEEEVLSAWERIQQREGLDTALSPWRSAKTLEECFGTLDAEILGGWGRVESMDKSRKLGWSGWTDTREGIRAAIEGLARLKMIPGLERR